MDFLKRHRGKLVVAAGLLSTLASVVSQYFVDDKTPTWQEMALAIGTALVAWMIQRPGDVTKAKATAMAEEHAANVLSQSMPPPGAPAAPSERFSVPPLDLPE